ncbi:MAG: DUF2255 family protein [Gaiellaceae bacterium]
MPLTQHEARISAGRVEKDVSFLETAQAADGVDAAYHTKYDRPYPSIVPSIIGRMTSCASKRMRQWRRQAQTDRKR